MARAVSGAKPVADRLCLQGILYVLHQDVAWQLRLELGFGSGQTCRRRPDRRQQAGVFDRSHRVLLAERHAAGNSTGPARAWTGPRSAPRTGRRGRPIAGRPAEDWQPTPSDLRREGHSAQGSAQPL
ncbi:transposase [Streptomyces sp. A2-16]|nr:transposase [Streptomyces sp. A2-16]